MAFPIPPEVKETLDPEIYRLKVKCNTYAQRLVKEGYDDVEWEQSPLIPIASYKGEAKEKISNELSLAVDFLDELSEKYGSEAIKKVSDHLLTIMKEIGIL